MAQSLILIPLFMWADRFIGGGYGWEKLGYDNGGPLRGGPALYALLPLALAAYWVGGWPFVTIVAAWGYWRRGMGWKLSGHSAMTPQWADIPYALVRHSFIAPILALASLVNPTLWPYVGLGISHAAVSTALAWRLTKGEITNHQLEPARGFIFGFLLVIIHWMQHWTTS